MKLLLLLLGLQGEGLTWSCAGPGKVLPWGKTTDRQDLEPSFPSTSHTSAVTLHPLGRDRDRQTDRKTERQTDRKLYKL